jgi:hypothetical protein
MLAKEKCGNGKQNQQNEVQTTAWLKKLFQFAIQLSHPYLYKTVSF